ncbi:MAG: outer membrane beta-barrel protein [Desulfobacterales bacterium]|jgi:predicted porin|nr:outer membrane beta-barrel protein [Desulfobacterales bacterium]
MKKIHVSLILVVSIVLAWGSASLAAQLLFTPRASVTEEYNDNIDLDRKNKKDDFITTVTFGGTLELLGQVSGLRVSYDPGYSFYADNDEFDSWRHNLFASAWHNFSRETRLEVFNYFLYSKDPLDNRDVENEAGDVIVRGDDTRRERDKYYRNQATARLSHQFGPENSSFVQFTHGLYKYDDPTREDNQEFTPSAGLTYWFSTWTGMEAGAEYTRGLYDEDTSSDFNNYLGRLRLNQRISQRFGVFAEYKHIYRDFDDSNIAATDDQDYMVYAPSAGFFYQFDPTLTASLGAGWFYQQIQNDKDEQGPFVSADLNKLWDYQRWNIRARLTSGIDSEDFSSNTRGFERYGQAELRGLYNFTRDFFGDCSLRYRYSDFIASDDDEVDHRYTADAGLGYRVTRWMTLRLAYQFNKLDNINGPDDYEQHRVYATLTLQPDQPWRLWD